jgi:hypothetical protein
LFYNEFYFHLLVLFPAVVSYGYEIRSLTLREEHRLRVFGNTVLRRIFGHVKKEVAGGSRGLHNEGLHNLYCSSNIVRVIKSRRMIWTGHVARIGVLTTTKF